MLDLVERRARLAVRRGAADVVGGVLVAVGLGFLTHAAWLALAEWRDPLFAAQTLGGLYVAAGGLTLLRAHRQKDRRPKAPTEPSLGHLALLEAFLVGLDAVDSLRTRKD